MTMAEENNIPFNYDDWKHCITVKCGIPLTKKLIEERLASLSNKKSGYTRKFIQVYGEEYTNQVISWFSLAKHEFKNN